MRIEHIIIGLIAIWAIYAIARHANRTEADKAKPSLAVRALNAAGGNVEAKRTLPAAGELIGRGVEAAGRGVRAAWDTHKGHAQQRKAERSATREGRADRAAELSQAAWDGAVHAAAKFMGVLHRRRAERTARGNSGRGWRWRWSRKKRADDRAEHDKPKARTSDTDAPESDTPEDEQPEQRTSRWRRFWRWGRGRRDGQADQADRPDQPIPEAGDESPDEDASAPVMHTETCTTCGKTYALTIPVGQSAREIVCRCGAKISFFRRSATDRASTDAPQPAADTTTSTVPQEDSVTATIDNQPTAAAAEPARIQPPKDWGDIGSRVAAFEPENDADLVNFMSAEIAGMCAYSDAYEALFETCTRSLGLDQRSVQGLGEFAEHVVGLTREMALAHKKFVVIYQEVMRAVADGTVMPYNGRFFTGDVQV
ncbi:hypothetical protein [Nonomuraea rhizosphaerae]|uniref:hypothetical protein n=1 Tax=Nonomuraea rhizosphaerae TaxID=2665663 RepID=UPI001C601323|nr:hypothetical protein [Nonomuraea rhizosphaerae]